MENILNAVLILGGMGLFFGIALSIAAKVFEVKQDERVSMIVDVLPGANCSGCGYTSCTAFAQAVAEGKGKSNGCPVGGVDVAKRIAQVMGVPAEEFQRRAARVKCGGAKGIANQKYTYEGINDCIAANKLMGGGKICSYACLGLGTCESVCRYGAITMKNGIAHIDPKKCTACGRCVAICPKRVIEIAPAQKAAFVVCNSKNKGAVVRKICSIGCIGCKICEKTCPNGAISVDNNIAKVDSEKCNNCGECISKCPRRVII